STFHSLRPGPSPTLFPYATLFRSDREKRFQLVEVPLAVDVDEIDHVVHAQLSLECDGRINAFALHVPAAAGLERAPLASELLERSEEHTSELQSLAYLVCRLLLEI